MGGCPPPMPPGPQAGGARCGWFDGSMPEYDAFLLVAFVTSAYSSYSSCRQYLDDIERARAAAGPDAPAIDKIRRFYDHPGFIEPFAASTRAALATLPADLRDGAHLVFTAHSVPVAMAEASGPGGTNMY